MTIERLLDLIALVESGGDKHAIGDHGRAYGLYQLHAEFRADYSDEMADTHSWVADERCITVFVRRFAAAMPDARIDELLAAFHLGHAGASQVDYRDPAYCERYLQAGATDEELALPVIGLCHADDE